MAAFSKIHEVLPEGFGYVVLAATGGMVLHWYLSVKVSKARKEYGVDLPKMYSDDKKNFNCVQRAHQSYLEGQGTFHILLFTSGLQYPRCSAAFGGVYLLGRFLSARGYSSGDPAKRAPGMLISHCGELLLLGGSVSLMCHLFGCFGKP